MLSDRGMEDARAAASWAFESALEARRRVIEVHRRAAEFHRRAAAFYSKHAEFDRQHGQDELAAEMESRAERERRLEASELRMAERADRASR
jgi:hypothetical protein